MQAWRFSQGAGGLDKHISLNKSTPLPPAAKNLQTDQILVRVTTASLNPVDYKLAENGLFRRLIYGADATPCLDYAGHVVAVGPNSQKISAQDLQVGQAVFGRLDNPTKYGTLAEYTIAPRVGCVPIPPGVSADDAACIGTAGPTAYQCIAPFVKPGNRVFINGGSGGVGLFAIQIAKALECHVITSCSTPNVELCKSVGADDVIDYRSSNVLRELQKRQAVDLIVDAVGTPSELYYQAHTYSNPKAVFTFIGADFSWGSAGDLLSRFCWPGALGGGKRTFKFIGVASNAEELARIAQWMADGKIRAVVDEKFGMDEKGAVRAYAKLKTHRAKGKILVRVAQ